MATNPRAIVMRRTGPPEVLAVEEVALAPLVRGEVRLRSLASAINHSDLQIRAGNWPITREPRFPYVPGLEVVGEVILVAALRPAGRYCIVGAAAGGEAAFDAWSLLDERERAAQRHARAARPAASTAAAAGAPPRRGSARPYAP